MNLSELASFPCNEDKRPLVQHGFKNARRAAWQSPLVGVPTGEANGFDVLDVDLPEGLAWYDANFADLPLTQAHETESGGLHLLLRHAPGLRCSAGRIAPGVDVRADGGYIIWWPRQGLPMECWPLREWPGWLLEEAREPKKWARGSKGHLSKVLSPLHRDDVGSLTEALGKLKPERWRNDEQSGEAFLEWFALMQASKFVGIEREVFVAWCTSDPAYAGDGEVIARMWDLAQPKHGGAFWAALRDAGVKLNQSTHHAYGAELTEVPLLPKPSTRAGRAGIGVLASMGSCAPSDRLSRVCSRSGAWSRS